MSTDIDSAAPASSLPAALETAVLAVSGVTGVFPSGGATPGVSRVLRRGRIAVVATGSGLLRVRVAVGVDPVAPLLPTVRAVAAAVREVVPDDVETAVVVRVVHVGVALPGGRGGVS